MKVYTGITGKRIAVDLTEIEAVLEFEDYTQLVTSSDLYKIRADFDAVVRDCENGR